MNKLFWKRALPTASSERFLALRDGQDVAAVDLDDLSNGTVAGTVVLVESGGWTEAVVSALFKSIDEHFLPEVDLARGNHTFTVVVGDVLGSYEAEAAGAES